MKNIIILAAIFAASIASAQTKAVLKNMSADAAINNTITESLTIGSGKTLTIASGATINATGATITGFTAAASWGSITGTLSAQTDLQSALDLKLSTATAATTYHPLTSTSTGGSGLADSGKLLKMNSIGGISLGSLSNNSVTPALYLAGGTASGLSVYSTGASAEAIDIQIEGLSGIAYSVHANGESVTGLYYDGAGATGNATALFANTSGLVISGANIDAQDRVGITGTTGSIEWYADGTNHWAGSNKTILSPATPSGTHTITVPSATGTLMLHNASGATLTALNASELGSGTVPAARMPALTGDVTTSAGAVAATIASGVVGPTQLASTAVTPGSYTSTNLTVDADGRITAASNGSGGGATLAANTFTGAQTLSVNGAASTPPLSLTGTILTGGTGTTNFPNFLIQPTGATVATGWSTSGTAIGVNLDTSAGRFLDLRVDGAEKAYFTFDGSLTTGGSVIAASGYVRAGNIYANSTSNVLDLYNNACILALGTSEIVNLNRDANYTLGIKNGTNPMLIKLYETDSGANDEYLEISAAAGTNTIKPAATGSGTASTVRYYTTPTVWFGSGSGTPEAVETAGIGSLFTDTATGTVYRKTSGTGNTGWVTP